VFESGLERLILGAATILWLAHSWYLNRQLIEARRNLERLLEEFPGIRESLSGTEPRLTREPWRRSGQPESQETKGSPRRGHIG